jgi:hypothetical protein
MASPKQPEVWQRGVVQGVPSLLQRVAHALLQAREEVNEMMIDFPETFLCLKPADVASVGFYLQHLKGVLDRLFTYAKGEMLHKNNCCICSQKERKMIVSILLTC